MLVSSVNKHEIIHSDIPFFLFRGRTLGSRIPSVALVLSLSNNGGSNMF